MSKPSPEFAHAEVSYLPKEPGPGLPHHRPGGIGVDLADTGEGAEVEVVTGARTGVVHRVAVVVVAVLNSVDDPVHDGADDGGVLEIGFHWYRSRHRTPAEPSCRRSASSPRRRRRRRQCPWAGSGRSGRGSVE